MKSIRGHLTILLAAGFGLLLVASGSAIYVVTRIALLGEFDAGLRATALAIMTQTEQNREGIQVELSDAMKQEFNNPAAPQFYELWQTNGTTVGRSDSLTGAELPRQFGSQASPEYWNLTLPGGLPGRAVGFKFEPKMEDEDRARIPIGDVILVVAENRRALDHTLATLAAVLVATGLLALAVTVPLVRFSVRHGHAPLEELSRQAAGIHADSLEERFPVESLPEELRPIIGRLNDLLQRLEASFERERRFSADLAHELRTPLAELRAHAEVGLQFAEGQGAEAYREPLNIALQMQAIVTRLLDLARSESGKIELQMEPVAIAALAEEIWRPLAALAAEKELQVQLTIPKDATMQTDATLFRAILANLFSNAVTYSPRGGMVEIVWRTETRELAVSNTVHDLKSEDVPHLFERLWRKDKSRTGSEHSGLGLAVSRGFATVLGLRLEAGFTGDGRLTVVLGEKTGG